MKPQDLSGESGETGCSGETGSSSLNSGTAKRTEGRKYLRFAFVRSLGVLRAAGEKLAALPRGA